MAHLLLAPRRAVVVLQHDLHRDAALMGADEIGGNPWQRQFLHGQLQALLGRVNGLQQDLARCRRHLACLIWDEQQRPHGGD